MVSAVLVLGAVAFHVRFRERRVVNLLGIWCLLWLLVPIPLDFDSRFVVKLQQISSWLSSQVLDLLQIRHLMMGTVLQMPQRELFVDEACSGIVSVMAVIATGAIWVVWLNRTLLHSVLLLLLGVMWAVLMNVARITAVAVAEDWWHYDLASGWQHDTLGFLLFTLTFVALISTDRVLCFVLDPVPKEVVGDSNPNFLIRMWNAIVTCCDPVELADKPQSDAADGDVSPTERVLSPKVLTLVSGAFLVVGGLQVVSWVRGYQDSYGSVDVALAIDRDALPSAVGDWELQNYDEMTRDSMNEFGQFSRSFTYQNRNSGETAMISMDFPFRGGWHELSVCYRNFGWPMQSRRVDSYPVEPDERNWMVIQAEYEKPEGQFGYLAFSGTNGSGECLEPPSSLVLWRPWFRLRRRLLRSISPRFFQVQVWVSKDEPISEEAQAGRAGVVSGGARGIVESVGTAVRGGIDWRSGKATRSFGTVPRFRDNVGSWTMPFRPKNGQSVRGLSPACH